MYKYLFLFSFLMVFSIFGVNQAEALTITSCNATVDLLYSSSNIQSGACTIEGPNSVSPNNPTRNTSGNTAPFSLTPGTYTYTMNCSGVTSNATIQVNAPVGGCSTGGGGSYSISATQPQICSPATQGNSNVSWTVPGGQYGYITNSNGTDPVMVSSSGNVTLPATLSPVTLYIYSCTGSTPGTCNTLAGSAVLQGTNSGCSGGGPIVCGNGIVQSGEQCDDGNTFNGDGCSSTCQNEYVPPTTYECYSGTCFEMPAGYPAPAHLCSPACTPPGQATCQILAPSPATTGQTPYATLRYNKSGSGSVSTQCSITSPQSPAWNQIISFTPYSTPFSRLFVTYPLPVGVNTMNAVCTTPTTSGDSYRDANCSVSFTVSNPSNQLTVSKNGTGSGTVTGGSSPVQPNINCGSTCSLSYTSGTWVSLTATPAPGSSFAGWTGCTPTSEVSCSVQINAATNVTATFNTNTPPTVSISPAPGTVRTIMLGQTTSYRVTGNDSEGLNTLNFDFRRPSGVWNWQSSTDDDQANTTQVSANFTPPTPFNSAYRSYGHNVSITPTVTGRFALRGAVYDGVNNWAYSGETYLDIIPQVPTLSANTDATCGGRVALSWNAIPNAQRYEIRRDGGAWFSVGNVTSYVDIGLTPGQSYGYRVRVVDNNNMTSYESGQVFANASAACVIPLPNLVSANTSPASGATFTNAQAITFTGTVTNNTVVAIGEGGWAGLEIDLGSDGIDNNPSDGRPPTNIVTPYNNFDHYLDLPQIGAFAANQVKTLSQGTFAGQFPVGTHRYRWHVDSTNNLAETNEVDNRSGWTTFTVIEAPKPDLIPQNLSVPAGITVGNSFNMSANARNSSTASAGGFQTKFTYRYGTSGGWNEFSPAKIFAKAGLGANANASTDSSSFTPTVEGNLYIQYCVDSNMVTAYGQIDEGASGESNNCAVSSSMVRVCPVSNPWNGSACAASLVANAPNCTIAQGASTCTSNVSWTITNPISPVSIRQNNVQFSSSASSNSTRTLQYGENNPLNTMNFMHNWSVSLGTRTPSATCVSGTHWNGSVCEINPPAPDVDIEADPDIVRSGETAVVSIRVEAPYTVDCEFEGALNNSFTHNGTVATTSDRSFTTLPLSSARIAQVTCTHNTIPAVSTVDEVRIEVIPTFQEI